MSFYLCIYHILYLYLCKNILYISQQSVVSNLAPTWLHLGSTLVPHWCLGATLDPPWFHPGSTLAPLSSSGRAPKGLGAIFQPRGIDLVISARVSFLKCRIRLASASDSNFLGPTLHGPQPRRPIRDSMHSPATSSISAGIQCQPLASPRILCTPPRGPPGIPWRRGLCA